MLNKEPIHNKVIVQSDPNSGISSTYSPNENPTIIPSSYINSEPQSSALVHPFIPAATVVPGDSISPIYSTQIFNPLPSYPAPSMSSFQNLPNIVPQTQILGTNSNFYTNTSYLLMPPGTPPSRPQTPDLATSVDMEDISLRPKWHQNVPIRRQFHTDDSSLETSSLISTSSDKPSLRVNMSTLPSPQDTPGIPVQDTVCPFHLNTSTWLA